MPLYEYECRKCGSVFEVLQKLSEEPLTVHDGCGGNLKRLLSVSAFQFKGSGFYITDYAGKTSKEKKKTESPTVKDVKGGDGKPGGDAKPAADSKPKAASPKT